MPLRSRYYLLFKTSHIDAAICYAHFPGKLLPPNVYNELETIVQKEYLTFLQDEGHGAAMISALKLVLSDIKFVEGCNLTCQECGLRYQQEARTKYDQFNVSRMM